MVKTLADSKVASAKTKYADALFVLADITGYTKFLKLHFLSKYHAEELVAEIIEHLIESAEGELKVAKIEGDAIFFYLPMDAGAPSSAKSVARRLLGLFEEFDKKVGELGARRLCVCDACSNVQDLTLKLVAHLGGIYARRIRGWEELAGPDVVLVHRLLKNGLPKRPYVLKTKAFREWIREAWPLESLSHVEEVPEYGRVDLFVSFVGGDAGRGRATTTRGDAGSVSDRVGQFMRIFWGGLLRQLGSKRAPPVAD